MAQLRAKLGEEAVIVTTQTLENGEVRLTGAIDERDLDLGDVLAPSTTGQRVEWLPGLGDFHGWPKELTEDLAAGSIDLGAGDPGTILTSLLRSMFRFDDLQGRQGKPILLSGSPGSGKSSTIAKLAAAQVLADRTVDVITMDAGRAGALDQLTTLLEPLGLQPKTAHTVGEARSLLASCSSNLVLIDSPGTNPYSSKEMGLVSGLAGQLGADLLLVMEASRGAADAAEIGESYAALGATRMIVTKLDTTRRLGSLLSAARAGLTLSGAGIGPTIGDGFRPLMPGGLARLLLRRYDDSLDAEPRS